MTSPKDRIVLTKNKKHLTLLSTKNKASASKISTTKQSVVKSSAIDSPRDNNMIYIDGDSNTRGVAALTKSLQRPNEYHLKSDKRVLSVTKPHLLYPVTQEATPMASQPSFFSPMMAQDPHPIEEEPDMVNLTKFL